MNKLIFIVALFICDITYGQNQYPENQNPNSMASGVYYQTGPGNNNSLLSWTYPYGTKLTVLGVEHRNFEITTTSYPYGDLKIRQWDPTNDVWINWRKILLENQEGNFEVMSNFKINNTSNRGNSFLKINRGGDGKDAAVVSFGEGDNFKWHTGMLYAGGWLTPDFYISQNYQIRDGNGNYVHEPELTIKVNGDVGIGTRLPDSKLTVKGNIHAEEVKVDLSVPGPDYVFKQGYDLKSLEEVQRYIKEHGHLPNIPSAKEMEANGIQLGKMNMKLLEKIEEQMLYILQMEKRIKELEKLTKK